jgi:hypothetical protein
MPTCLPCGRSKAEIEGILTRTYGRECGVEDAALIQQSLLQCRLECAINSLFSHDIDQRRIVGNLFGKLDGLVNELIGGEDLNNRS